MTTLIGMLTADGPLIAADSQVTGDFKSYTDKIVSLREGSAAVCFALCGNQAIGLMAVQECFEAIREIPPSARAVDGIRKVIKRTIKPIQTDYVDRIPIEIRQDSIFDFIISIATKKEPVGRLFYTQDAAVVEASDGWVCQGSGARMASYFMKLGFRRDLDWNESVVLAMRALTAAKNHDPLSGGKTQFAVLRDGRTVIIPHSVETTEGEIQRFEELCGNLLQTVLNPDNEREEFKNAMSRFYSDIEDLRERTLAASEGVRMIQSWFDESAKAAAATKNQ